MNKLIVLIIFTTLFTVKSFSQLNIKVKVETIAVQNPLDCDGFSLGDSDFLFEYKATDNSPSVFGNNNPTAGSIGNCNYALVDGNNGSYSLSPSAPGTAIFSPLDGIFLIIAIIVRKIYLLL